MVGRLRTFGVVAGTLFMAVAAVDLSGRPPEVRPSDKALTYPAQVLIIRHAEKPVDDPKSPDLTPEGTARAAALSRLFVAAGKQPAAFSTPDFIFAGKDTKKSHRPLLTVTPLAKQLKLTVNTEYGNDNVDKLAAELFHNPKYAGKTVLISWRHSNIPQLAAELKAPNSPTTWKGEVFDRVWQISYDKTGRATFVDRPQQLMAKDSEK